MKHCIYSMALGAAGVLAATEPGFATKRPPSSTVEPSLSSILAAQATAQPSSPTSNVQGAAFDRIIQIWLENTDYEVRPLSATVTKSCDVHLLNWVRPTSDFKANSPSRPLRLILTSNGSPAKA